MERRYVESIFLNSPLPEDSYLLRLPAVRAIGDREHQLPFDADVTFLVGGERQRQVHAPGGHRPVLRL